MTGRATNYFNVDIPLQQSLQRSIIRSKFCSYHAVLHYLFYIHACLIVGYKKNSFHQSYPLPLVYHLLRHFEDTTVQKLYDRNNRHRTSDTMTDRQRQAPAQSSNISSDSEWVTTSEDLSEDSRGSRTVARRAPSSGIADRGLGNYRRDGYDFLTGPLDKRFSENPPVQPRQETGDYNRDGYDYLRGALDKRFGEQHPGQRSRSRSPPRPERRYSYGRYASPGLPPRSRSRSPSWSPTPPKASERRSTPRPPQSGSRGYKSPPRDDRNLPASPPRRSPRAQRRQSARHEDVSDSEDPPSRRRSDRRRR